MTKKRYIPFLFALLACVGFSFPANAQTETAPSVDLLTLLNERSARIEQGQDTRELDQQLFDAAYRPKAIIHTQTLENGSRRITFPIYLIIPEDRKERVVQRLTSHYTYLSAMEIHTESREIVINVPATVSTEELNAIFDHFGYLGYEEH